MERRIDKKHVKNVHAKQGLDFIKLSLFVRFSKL